MKEKLLHVSPTTLAEQTAVCEDVAKQMAQGAIEALDVDYAVAATGVAGPQGGTESIPVGTIWLCCSSRAAHITLCLTSDRGREANLNNAVAQALQLLINFIKG